MLRHINCDTLYLFSGQPEDQHIIRGGIRLYIRGGRKRKRTYEQVNESHEASIENALQFNLDLLKTERTLVPIFNIISIIIMKQFNNTFLAWCIEMLLRRLVSLLIITNKYYIMDRSYLFVI